MPHSYRQLDDLHAPYDHIYLSPHLDDAALSCGGGIARFVANGHAVLVVNICSGSPAPDAEFSPFAQEMHGKWGLPAAEAVAMRRVEDNAALEILGVDAYQLDLLDAIYRMPAAYSDDPTLFGTVDACDSLVDALRLALLPLLARYPEAILYAPLGVGRHVDHQVAYQVAVELIRGGTSVAFYEDFPYVAASGALEQRLAELGGGELFLPVVTPIDATLARKISAIDAYTSQIASLFGDAARMGYVVTSYAEGLRPDAGTYGERLWMRR